MVGQLNKPRVFLSHSKKDIDFIERLDADLRKCQIDTWIDTVEIRHGKSWQDSIFQFGLPTCDAVIVYFTELSLQSPVVRKEMDVALLQTLKDKNVAFLPYISDANRRTELRPDIQALQTPEWNEKNYYSLLPIVVSEIWRSYLERIVSITVKDEQLKRTQLELELEKKNSQTDSVFSPLEMKEFDYIYGQFNKSLFLSVDYIRGSRFVREHISDEDIIAKNIHQIEINLHDCFCELNNFDKNEYSKYDLGRSIYKLAYESISIDPSFSNIKDDYRQMVGVELQINNIPNMIEQLSLFGLVKIETIRNEDANTWNDLIIYRYIFSEKYYRYRYWLAYFKKLSNKIELRAQTD